MAKVSVGKTFEFAAAHRLFRSEWSNEKNLEVYGKCSGSSGHGHNYRLEVTVEGLPDPQTGFAYDASALDKLVTKEVLSKLDHKNIDTDVEWFSNRPSTVENIVNFIWEQLNELINKNGSCLFNICRALTL